jgi:hypothetical protein
LSRQSQVTALIAVALNAGGNSDIPRVELHAASDARRGRPRAGDHELRVAAQERHQCRGEPYKRHVHSNVLRQSGVVKLR